MSRVFSDRRFDSVEAFDDWALEQEGKWELHDGVAVLMSPERLDHARIKARVWQALDRSLRQGGRSCEAIVDGPLVPGPGLRRHQPDVFVFCGGGADGQDVVVQEPVIVVEVISPGSQAYDTTIKLESYFALPSVQHYLIVSMKERLVIQHTRQAGNGWLTTLHREGTISLDPPGAALVVADIYAGSDVP